jgi:hypothetical protein
MACEVRVALVARFTQFESDDRFGRDWLLSADRERRSKGRPSRSVSVGLQTNGLVQLGSCWARRKITPSDYVSLIAKTDGEIKSHHGLSASNDLDQVLALIATAMWPRDVGRRRSGIGVWLERCSTAAALDGDDLRRLRRADRRPRDHQLAPLLQQIATPISGFGTIFSVGQTTGSWNRASHNSSRRLGAVLRNSGNLVLWDRPPAIYRCRWSTSES